MNSEASNLSCSEESKHIEMVPAVLNKRRIWQKYVKLSFLKRLFRNKWAIVRRGAPAASRSKESPARTTRASFPACGSSVITFSDLRELADLSLSGDAPSSMSEPFRNWLGMGVTIPARIQPGSIDLVNPLPLVLGRLWLYERKPAIKVFLFSSWIIFRCVHRRGNRNASFSAGVAWSGSVAWVRSGKWPPRQRVSQRNRPIKRS
ncbi:hypothetical protein Lal_00038484 [Lupinus albus]|nr:hypothetical protein Lal_00038484 [Lupinus albus]